MKEFVIPNRQHLVHVLSEASNYRSAFVDMRDLDVVGEVRSPKTFDAFDVAREMLQQAIEENDVLADFDSEGQVVLGRKLDTSPGYLAKWLIAQSHETNAEEAVRSLEKYLADSALDCQFVMFVNGITLSRGYEFADGIKVVPYCYKANSKLVDRVHDYICTGAPIPTVINAIVYEYRRNGLKPSIDNASPDLVSIERRLKDVCLCISLVCEEDCAVQPIFSTEEMASEAVPLIAPNSRQWWSYEFRHPQSPFATTDGDYEAAATLFGTFERLNEDMKTRLRWPMEKLCQSRLSRSCAQGAIDLRVALESLFLDNSTTDVRATLADRVGFHHRGSSTEMGEVGEVIRSTFDTCSRVAKTGHMTADSKQLDAMKQCRKLLRSTLIKMINKESAS